MTIVKKVNEMTALTEVVENMVDKVVKVDV